jgi:hypothetical protein
MGIEGYLLAESIKKPHHVTSFQATRLYYQTFIIPTKGSQDVDIRRQNGNSFIDEIFPSLEPLYILWSVDESTFVANPRSINRNLGLNLGL